MKSPSNRRNQLIAEFFSNIGVAWFAGGVIGVLIDQRNNIYEIIYINIFSLIFCIIFLFFGVKLISK